MAAEKKNLLGLTLKELEVFFESQGQQKFRAKQVFQWMHQKYVDNFDLMSDLSKDLRIRLNELSSVIIKFFTLKNFACLINSL